MIVGVVNQQPLCRGGCIKLSIGGDQRKRRELNANLKGGRELHGIITTQGVSSGKRGSVGD